jgi:hypothetical protein
MLCWVLDLIREIADYSSGLNLSHALISSPIVEDPADLVSGGDDFETASIAATMNLTGKNLKLHSNRAIMLY